MMKNRKDMVIVALATFCLTATLFMVLPIRSQPNGYDAWLDTNDDGSINILEGILLSNHFLTSGDPTKNVNVMNELNVTVKNWPQQWKMWTLIENVPFSWVIDRPDNRLTILHITIPTEGFSRLRFYGRITDFADLQQDENSVAFILSFNSSIGVNGAEDFTTNERYSSTLVGWHDSAQGQVTGFYPSEMFIVQSPYLDVSLDVVLNINTSKVFPPTVTCKLSVYAYMRNE